MTYRLCKNLGIATALLGVLITYNSAMAATAKDIASCILEQDDVSRPSDTSTVPSFLILTASDSLLGLSVPGDPLNIPNLELPDGIKLTDIKVNKPVALNIETGSDSSRANLSFSKAKSAGDGKLQTTKFTISAPLAKSGGTSLNRFGTLASDGNLELSHVRFGRLWDFDPLTTTEIEGFQSQILAKMKNEKDKICKKDADCKSKVAKLRAKEIKPELSCIKAFLGDPGVKDYKSKNVHTPKSTPFLGAAIALGYKTFDFKNPMDNSDDSATETPWSVELYTGRYSSDRKSLFRLGFSYKEDFKASKELSICQAPDENGRQECEANRFAGPEDDNESAAFIEFRRQFSKESFLKAMQIKFSYDFEENEPEIDIPLYLFSDSKKNLNGGVRVTWQEKNDISVGLFVGAAFDPIKL